MSGIEDILKSTHSDRLEKLLDEPETQRVFSLLNQKFGGNLKEAAENAASGNTEPLVSAIKQLMQNPEGSRLIEQLKEKIK